VVELALEAVAIASFETIIGVDITSMGLPRFKLKANPFIAMVPALLAFASISASKSGLIFAVWGGSSAVILLL
jgi:hypothetical protein